MPANLFELVGQVAGETDDAFAVLTYSQSSNPASPHYSDMTEVYSAGGWNDMPFCPEDIEAEKISETQISTKQPGLLNR